MAEVSGIELKRTTAEVRLYDGTTIVCRKSDISALKLHEGARFNRGALCKLQFDEAYEAALSLLDYSAKTRSELTKKLLAKGYLEEVADAVAERLIENRLLDDKYIAQRVTEGAKSKGVFAIKQKLRARGVGEDDIEEALSGISDDDQIEAAYAEAVRVSRKYAGLEPRVYKAKLSQALARRGFTWDSIETALDRLINEDY